MSASIARHIRGQLDLACPVDELVPIEELTDVCENLYNYVIELWIEEILNAVQRYADLHDMAFHSAPVSQKPYMFLLGDVVYSLRVSTSPTDTRTICLNITMASTDDATRLITRKIPLDVTGRYRAILVYLDSNLDPIFDLVFATSEEAVVAGDRWIESFVVSQLATIQGDPVAQLYALVRRPFSTQLGRMIRIYLVDPSEGGGIFMDDEARKETINNLAGYAYTSFEKSPVELLSGLLVARFSIEDTVAREIVPSMTTVVKSPLEIPSGTQVGLAQYIMYGGGMVLQPLVAFDQLWMEAAYPASVRPEIEPTLWEERSTIQSAVQKLRFGRVSDGTELSRSRRGEQARREGLGEHISGLIGRFTGGFVSEYIQ